MNGEKIGVGKYHFSTQVEPFLTFDEVGLPKAMRGIHFPENWDVTLQQFENVAPEGKEPQFVEMGRIENVAQKKSADGMENRRSAWWSSHGKENQEKT